MSFALSVLQGVVAYGRGLECIQASFISLLITCVESSKIQVAKSSLQILSLLSTSPSHGFSVIHSAFVVAGTQSTSNLPFKKVVAALNNPDAGVQNAALTFINDMIRAVPTDSYTSFLRLLDDLNIIEIMKVKFLRKSQKNFHSIWSFTDFFMNKNKDVSRISRPKYKKTALLLPKASPKRT